MAPAEEKKVEEKPAADGAKNKKDGKKEEKKVVELSDDDLLLKENLELMVTRVADPDSGVAKLALETMRKEIRTATRCANKRLQRTLPISQANEI